MHPETPQRPSSELSRGTANNADLCLVGIGAAEGGVEALRQLLAPLAPDSGLAFVVMLRLPPEERHATLAAFQQHSLLPIVAVTTPAALAPNHIYLIPPERRLVIRNGALELAERAHAEAHRGVLDEFFCTLAAAHGPNAAAIVLSGAGADGAIGVQCVKAHGGLILAQLPEEAALSEMPSSAIATGLVDDILPAAQMPARLTASWSRTRTVGLSADTLSPADEPAAPARSEMAPPASASAPERSEELFRRAIEDAPIPVIMHAEDGEVLQISRSWTELTGYTLADVPTLDAWLNHAYGDGADAVRSHVHDVFGGNRRTLDVTFDIRVRTGEVRHWSFSASSPGTLRDGRRFVVGMAVDITERTRVERALAERARLLDLSNDAIIVRDVNNRIIYWNRGATDIYGWSHEEALGQDLHTLLQTEFEAPFEQLTARLHEQDRIEGEVAQVTRDGRRLTLLCRWSLDRDAQGRPGAILTTYNDITERKQAEAARRESEARFRLLIEGARDYAMFLLDSQNHITFWSAGAERLFGWSEAEALGQPGAIIFTPEDRAADAPEQERATALAEGSAVDRRWHIRKDGRRLFLDGVLIHLDGAGGDLHGFAKIGRDATAQRQDEEAIERLNAELEARVQERTAALVATNQARQELLRQLVTTQEEERLRIARDLHDQLGQQITGLQLGLKQLEEPAQGTPLAAKLPPLQALAVDMANEAHRLAVNLRPLALDDVGLVSALERLVADWSAHVQVPAGFHSRGLDGGRLPPVLETTLYRVVQEALTNIGKYAAARSVSVLLERRAEQVVAIVEDDGRGFDPDVAPADQERPRLGLRGMRERVAQLEGTLEVESSPGSGTTIFVRIPLDEQERRS